MDGDGGPAAGSPAGAGRDAGPGRRTGAGHDADHDADRRQIAAVVRLLEDVVGDALVGAWLHGSAVLGRLRPTSDLDVLALATATPTRAQRRRLLAGLLDVSAPPGRADRGRPVELTVAVTSDLVPWRYPPNAAFQYGEWLRAEYEAGVVPGPGPSSDLALLVEVARRCGRVLIGPAPGAALPAVPAGDLGRATREGTPALLDEVATDTRNVLLTLARTLVTLESGEIVTKDAAADRLLPHLPETLRPVLRAARDDYLGAAAPNWTALRAPAEALAAWCAAEIGRR